MKKLISFAVLSLCAISAFGQSRSATVTVSEANVDCIKPYVNILATPLIADVQVSTEKVTYVESEAFRNYAITEALIQQLPTLKNIAVSNAVKKYNADLFVGINISVSTNPEGFLEITVIGYPANYSNFRNATNEEVISAYNARLATLDRDIDPLETDKEPTKIIKK